MFYAYLWLRKDGTPYYVGKGKGDRAFTNQSHNVRCPSLDRVIVQEYSSEEEAFEAEIFLISFYGRKDLGTGCLRNLTDGGENPPNWRGKKRSLHHSQAMSKSRTGVKQPNISKAKMGNKCSLGVKRSPEFCKMLSERGKLKRLTPEQKKAVGDFFRGKKLPPETRARMSERMRNLWKTNPNWRKKRCA